MFIISQLFNEFFKSEKAGGLMLIAATTLSLVLANSFLQDIYSNIWAYPIWGHSMVHWVNDGLMAIFFLLIGLELEREIYMGELSNLKKASLPIFAAIGGMIIPAGIFLAMNWGTDLQNGFGIPMATDIAFAIGILSLLGSRVPLSLKIFLTALAVIDDLGAILVIALFYTDSVSVWYLISSLGVWLFLILLNRLKIHVMWPYIIGGIAMWFLMLNSGVHATISGVLLAFAIPFGKGNEHSPSFRLQHVLHYPVALLILPLFAMANTGISINTEQFSSLFNLGSIGIIAGLTLGKPVGIVLFSMLAIYLGISSTPEGVTVKSIIGVGFLGGIGFTMSIFIALLAFDSLAVINASKLAILSASILAGIMGYLFLWKVLPK